MVFGSFEIVVKIDIDARLADHVHVHVSEVTVPMAGQLSAASKAYSDQVTEIM